MLKMEHEPKSPFRQIVVMSLCWIFSWEYELVKMLVLTNMIDLMVLVLLL